MKYKIAIITANYYTKISKSLISGALIKLKKIKKFLKLKKSMYRDHLKYPM